MKELREIYSEMQDDIERSLRLCVDGKAAAETLVTGLERIKEAYLDQGDVAADRREVNRLFDVARAGVAMVATATEAEISLRLPSVAAHRRVWRFRDILPWIPALLSGILAIWLFFDQQTNAAFVALLSAAAFFISVREMRPGAAKTPAMIATPKVGVQDALRQMGDVIDCIDRGLREPALPQAEPLRLTPPLLESVQMLMEANEAKDGLFALKALPQITIELERQGIEILSYSPETRAYFDLYPAQTGGETIRPALLLHGAPLSRGQATIAEG